MEQTAQLIVSEQFFSGKVIIFCRVTVSEIAMVQVSRVKKNFRGWVLDHVIQVPSRFFPAVQ